MLHKLPMTTRRLLAGLLVAAGVAYGALLVATYVHNTAPNSIAPDLRDVSRLLFRDYTPISPMQRRLEAGDTPLGTGPLISGKPISQQAAASMLNDRELAQREAERQALLDWIRTGASRAAYEHDDYAVASPHAASSITPELLVCQTGVTATARVRIRSLINQRCVSCHDDDGDDTARLIPFTNYDSIAHYLIPDDQGNGGRAWLITALGSLFPLAALAGAAFAFTVFGPKKRNQLLIVTTAALAIVAACWLLGSSLAPLLPIAALVAAICIFLQLLASAVVLVGYKVSV